MTETDWLMIDWWLIDSEPYYAILNECVNVVKDDSDIHYLPLRCTLHFKFIFVQLYVYLTKKNTNWNYRFASTGYPGTKGDKGDRGDSVIHLWFYFPLWFSNLVLVKM